MPFWTCDDCNGKFIYLYLVCQGTLRVRIS